MCLGSELVLVVSGATGSLASAHSDETAKVDPIQVPASNNHKAIDFFIADEPYAGEKGGIPDI